MSEAIRHYTNEFRAARDVSPYDAEVLFDALISEKDVSLLVELLSAWSQKGATQDEMYRFAAILRQRMKRVDTRGLACVDIVGTGGSSAKTFNVSTAAASGPMWRSTNVSSERVSWCSDTGRNLPTSAAGAWSAGVPAPPPLSSARTGLPERFGAGRFCRPRPFPMGGQAHVAGAPLSRGIGASCGPGGLRG